jgi:hypothetical protein
VRADSRRCIDGKLPLRGANYGAVAYHKRCLDHSISPEEVFYEQEEDQLILLDGMHRWRASLAYGFAEIPCLLMTREWAAEFRGYVRR